MTDAFIILTVVFIAPRNPLNIYMVIHSFVLVSLNAAAGHCKCQLWLYVVLRLLLLLSDVRKHMCSQFCIVVDLSLGETTRIHRVHPNPVSAPAERPREACCCR